MSEYLYFLTDRDTLTGGLSGYEINSYKDNHYGINKKMVQGMWDDFKSYKNGTTDSLMGLGLITYNIIEEDINLDNQIKITIKTPLVSGIREKKCSFYKMKNIPSSIDISKTGSYYLDD